MTLKRYAAFLLSAVLMLNMMTIVQAADSDGDGFDDDTGEDDCPDQYGTSTLDLKGCPDSDGDYTSDINDAFPDDPSQSSDVDGDGFGDNPAGWWPDACPYTLGASYIDMNGCPDSDSDGISDENDACPGTGAGASVDLNGCAPYEIDTDSDGVTDDSDLCPGTGPGATVDSDGCAANQYDADGDGIPDVLDLCPLSNPEYSVDEDGCGIDQIDSDADGIADVRDFCPDTQIGLPVDTAGCSASQSDWDNDGYSDAVDAFPQDPEQWFDSDGDGFGDNPQGKFKDDCPSQVGTSTVGLTGCPDTDGDGMADLIDQCPTEASNLSLGCPDIDEDGFLDYGKTRVDSCPLETGNSDQGGVYGCIDSDGDGWADMVDSFDDDDAAWGDGDDDGFADQSGLNYSDDCPSSKGNSTIYLQGCPDIDGDGIPDFFDEDIDGDGIINTWEKQVEPATNASDSSQTPLDTDSDGLPDDLDKDDDGDGFPDEIEESRGSDPLDPEETPLSTVRGIDLGFSTGFIYSSTGESAFSTDYSDDGFEVSLTRLISVLTSGAIAFLLPLIASLPLLMKKKNRFKRIQDELEEITSLERLEVLEYEIDDLIAKKRLRIDNALLLRNLLERKQDEFQRPNPVSQPSMIQTPPPHQPPPLQQPPPMMNQFPGPHVQTSVDENGFEWTKGPEGEDLYRKIGTTDWMRWD